MEAQPASRHYVRLVTPNAKKPHSAGSFVRSNAALGIQINFAERYRNLTRNSFPEIFPPQAARIAGTPYASPCIDYDSGYTGELSSGNEQAIRRVARCRDTHCWREIKSPRNILALMQLMSEIILLISPILYYERDIRIPTS